MDGELERRQRFMDGKGYRRCDIPACNCGSWHGGNAETRLMEIATLLEAHGLYPRGNTAIDAIRGLLTLQTLYDSEINFSLSTFWDAGFDWALGDDLNGFKEAGNARSFSAAVEALVRAAIAHYPESDFVKGLAR